MLWHVVQCIVITMGLLAVGLAQEHPAPRASATGTSLKISGVLVDAVTGKPVRQARVTIRPEDRIAFTTIVTGENGRFVFSNLAPGKYWMTGERRGYRTQPFNWRADGHSSSVVVGPGLNSSGLVFRLLPECTISGRISDEAGEPVPNAYVTLYQTATREGEQGTHNRGGGTTDEEGTYQINHLPPGKYFVAVKARPWYASTSLDEQSRPSFDVVYPLTFYPGVTEDSAATAIVVKGGDRFVADVSLQPVRALHVRIPADEISGKPFFIELHSTAFGIPVSGEQGNMVPSGDIEIAGLVPGHYEARICEDGPCNGRPAATKSAELDVSSSGEISLEHETPFVHVGATVQLEPGTATPLQGSLQLSCPNTFESARAQLGDAGEIDFKQTIPPGRCELSLINSSSEFIKTASVTGGTLTGYSVEVKGPGVLKLNLTIARGRGSVVGVALREGKPVTGAMIVLAPSDPEHNRVLFRQEQSDSNGTFTINAVVPGKYTLLAIENGWDLEWLKPAVLKPYLAAGQVLAVEQNGKYETKINVQ